MFEFVALWSVNLNFVIMLTVGDKFLYLLLSSWSECRVHVFHILFKTGFPKKIFSLFNLLGTLQHWETQFRSRQHRKGHL